MANLSNINNKFLVTTGGAVGVGVTNPGSKLSIGGTTGSYDSGIGFQPTGTGARIYRTFIATDGSFRFDDVTAGYLTRLTIDSSGNVGIGGSPSAWALGKTIQINSNYGTINYNGISAILGIINAYYNGSAYIRQNVGYAGSIDFNTAISGGGFAFRTENTTGSAGDTVTLSTKMAITSAGNVGIGTASPGTFLQLGTYAVAGKYINQATYPDIPSEHMMHITAPSTNAYYGGGISFGETAFTAANIVVRDAGGSGALDLCFGTGTASGVTEKMRIANNGNVGIGTASSPGYKLDVVGSIKASVQGRFANGSASTPAYSFDADSDTGIYRATTNALGFSTAGTNSLTIDYYKAAFAGDIELNGANKYIYFRTATDSGLWQEYNFSLRFGTNNVERMRIDSSGNVGIKNTSPSDFLSWQQQLVVGNGSSDAGITIYHGSGSGNQGAIVFADGNTGTNRYRGSISYNGADEMKFFTSTSERMRIDSSGGVSITPTTSTSFFYGADGTNSYINFETNNIDAAVQLYAGYSSGGYFAVGTKDSGGTLAERMRIDGSGNVIFQQSGSTGVANSIAHYTNNFMYVRGGTAGLALGDDAMATSLYMYDNNFMAFNTAGAEKMRITSDGALLVGGTSPPSTSWKGTAVFGQQGTNKVIIGYLSAFSENVVGGHNSALDAWDSLTLAGTDFKFRTGSGATNTSMVIDSSGNVGIGATSIYPQGSNTILKLYSTSIPRFYLQNTTTGSNTTDGSQIYVSGSDLYITNSESANTIFSTNSLERMRVNSQGNFLVGATALSDVGSLTKSHLLEGISETAGTGAVGVYNNSGTANCPSLVVLNRDTSTDSSNRFIQFYANVIGATNTPMGGIVGNGASNVQFASLSDIREKENVKTINGSLDKISKLNPVEFDWKKSGEHINAGFIAQEVENIFPEYVVENISNEDEEERKGLTGGMTSGIVAHLVKSIQELKADNDSLKARIETLENK